MTPEILQVASADGATAELIVHPSPRGEFVYWLPALGVTARHYARFAEALAAEGIGLARHEWRGAGSSNLRARRGVDWRYRDLLGDIRDGLAVLRAKHADARIWIGGHSLGAQFAALALARDPALAGVVIVASGTPYWRSFPWWQRPILLLVFAWFRLLSDLFGYFPGRRTAFAGNEARSVIHDWITSGLSGRYRHAWPEGDLDAELRTRSHPLFALHLRDDRFAPPSSFDELVARLPNATAQIHRLAPADFESRVADHFSWMKDPAPIASRILDFIAAARGGT
jgi:predicted alpha/beta hydrolase